MTRKFLLNAAIMVSALIFAGAAHAGTIKGTCTMAASAISGKKFVTLKCSKATEPGDYIIRSTVWEKDDRKQYGRMARFSGRRFSCDLVDTGRTRDGGMEITHYQIKDCR